MRSEEIVSSSSCPNFFFCNQVTEWTENFKKLINLFTFFYTKRKSQNKMIPSIKITRMRSKNSAWSEYNTNSWLSWRCFNRYQQIFPRKEAGFLHQSTRMNFRRNFLSRKKFQRDRNSINFTLHHEPLELSLNFFNNRYVIRYNKILKNRHFSPNTAITIKNS